MTQKQWEILKAERKAAYYAEQDRTAKTRAMKQTIDALGNLFFLFIAFFIIPLSIAIFS